MPFADGEPVARIHFVSALVTRRFWPEVVFEILPVIAALEVGAERAAGVVAAVDHAVLAARVARDAVDDAIFVPVHFLEHLPVAGVMAVGHEVTGRFPAPNVARGNGPGGARQLALAGEKLLINRRAEDREPLAPFLNVLEFLPRHLAREEEVLRVAAKPLRHVLLR